MMLVHIVCIVSHDILSVFLACIAYVSVFIYMLLYVSIFLMCIYFIDIVFFMFFSLFFFCFLLFSFILLFVLFFFKQKTAYEMRISDWSSDVCSSDLYHADPGSWFTGIGNADRHAAGAVGQLDRGRQLLLGTVRQRPSAGLPDLPVSPAAGLHPGPRSGTSRRTAAQSRPDRAGRGGGVDRGRRPERSAHPARRAYPRPCSGIGAASALPAVARSPASARRPDRAWPQLAASVARRTRPAPGQYAGRRMPGAERRFSATARRRPACGKHLRGSKRKLAIGTRCLAAPARRVSTRCARRAMGAGCRGHSRRTLWPDRCRARTAGPCARCRPVPGPASTDRAGARPMGAHVTATRSAHLPENGRATGGAKEGTKV